MKMWCIVEEKEGKAEVTTYITQEEAIREAQECWDKYTNQESVDHFYIAFIDTSFGVNIHETYIGDISLFGRIVQITKEWK